MIERGDLDAGFAAAEFVFEDTFRTGGTQHVPMETHVTIADARRGHDAQIWAATQGPYILRAELASVLGLPESRVRVMVPTLGRRLRRQDLPQARAARGRALAPRATLRSSSCSTGTRSF